MPRRGNTRSRQIDDAARRPVDQILLIDQVVLNAVITTHISDPVSCGAFRHFALYLRLLSAGTPTTLQIIPQFLQEQHGLWHNHVQGPFSSLYYEHGDTATEVRQVFEGALVGRQMRIKMIGVGTSAVNTFTVSAALDLWD